MSNIQEKIYFYSKQLLKDYAHRGINTENAIQFIQNLVQQAVEEERMRILEDMKLKMENWHGTGLAMIEDYKSLIQKDK